MPMQYHLHDKKARRVFAVATAGVVAFVLFNASFYSQLFQPIQDLVRVGEDTIELYNAVAAKFAAKNATTAADHIPVILMPPPDATSPRDKRILPSKPGGKRRPDRPPPQRDAGPEGSHGAQRFKSPTWTC